MATAKKTVKRTDAAADSFTAEEKAAMKERAKELKRNASAAEEEQAVLDKIAIMPDADRKLAERIHTLVKAAAPELTSKLWYGMPAYYKEARASASSRTPPSSRPATPPWASTRAPGSTTATCGHPASP